MSLVVVVIALGAIAVEKQIKKKKLRNMKKEKYERYNRAQEQKQQGGYPPQYPEPYQDSGLYSPPATTGSSSRMNYKRGRRMTNESNQTAPTAASEANIGCPKVQLVAANNGAFNTPPPTITV
ncbi:hypothetical protein CANMA_002542 [Candida margitis]|uniref:uncharacterized protein n=1 Tax=Candida margitis TaxID=1775924 RepID=UPI0022261AB1|nr:uncharacterized protein CANMA_002542 [Candida margitis]KAI5968326.1 hypothetical protein CANMA_002542 [Candida margitis]